MKSVLITSKTTLFVLLSSISLLFLGCQTEPEPDLEVIQNQLENQRCTTIVNHGKVQIKLEPHGSVRATVFQGQIAVYEFILDREKQQNLLTSSIDEADVYLTGEFRDGLVIDDRQSQKRYVLSFYDIADRLKDIITIQHETVFVKGYAMSLSPIIQSVALLPY